MRETRLWLLSLASTVLILVLLGMHFALMHYSPVFYQESVAEVRSFAAMLERGRETAFFVIYILLLAAALYHGLYGLRGIILELPFARAWGRPISAAILLVGLAFFAYGTYVTWWTFNGGSVR
jgi:succinate dehydrogenase / fumarate reductase membrane anchor subunit